MAVLHSHHRLAPFLCEVAAAISSSLHPTTLTSLLRGLVGGFSAEGLSGGVRSVLRGVVCVLYSLVSEAVAGRVTEDTCPPNTLISLLLDTPIWKEVAQCQDLAGTVGPGPGVDFTKQVCPHVEIAVRCARVRSDSQCFKSLLPALEWVLEALPGETLRAG